MCSNKTPKSLLAGLVFGLSKAPQEDEMKPQRLAPRLTVKKGRLWRRGSARCRGTDCITGYTSGERVVNIARPSVGTSRYARRPPASQRCVPVWIGHARRIISHWGGGKKTPQIVSHRIRLITVGSDHHIVLRILLCIHIGAKLFKEDANGFGAAM